MPDPIPSLPSYFVGHHRASFLNQAISSSKRSDPRVRHCDQKAAFGHCSCDLEANDRARHTHLCSCVMEGLLNRSRVGRRDEAVSQGLQDTSVHTQRVPLSLALKIIKKIDSCSRITVCNQATTQLNFPSLAFRLVICLHTSPLLLQK